MPKLASSERHHLHVIKASAGSGKTHRLTGEYLHLLFSGPQRYRHILAVTFTNKATDEMKSRIVQELHRLASGGDSSYLRDLTADFGLNEAQVRVGARSILENILHDFSSFSISTIDRFFQQTMRAFTREMGLSGGYNIELDESTYLMETVDLMLSELDQPENKMLSNWLLLFMQQSIEEGKSWKINRQVLDLARQLFNETYKSFTGEEEEKIRDKEFLLSYQQTLRKIVRAFEREVKETGERGLAVMSQYGLHFSDFSGSSRSPFSYFVKWANKEIKSPTATFLLLENNPEKWVTRTTPADKRAAIEAAYSGGLNDAVQRAVGLFANTIPYNSALSILRNFYTLGILNDIQKRLRKLLQENNTLFLSDTTELLNHMIAGTDTPFIYEKTGTRITNYMIDEFQDTSRMQWHNFKPLVGESLASANFNLIVGDVKQSIYRFRNSDWRLLESQIGDDFPAEHISAHVLDTNWRSDKHIVQFNNAFFTQSPLILQQDFNTTDEDLVDTQITDAYRDAYQRVPPSKNDSGGQVKVTFLQDEKDADWKAEVLEQLPHEIERLQDQGFALKDIAVVVRWNHEAVLVAETLLAYAGAHADSPYRYDLISNEALLIGNAQSVKAVIALMRHFRDPKDNSCRMMAAFEYYRLHRNASPEEALQLYREEAADTFPEEIMLHLRELSSLPFYDMTERFFALSGGALKEKENAYIQAFLDLALKFSTRTTTDLGAFLDWWDEKGCRKTLFSPEDQDAIRLITIHKSKGLGFGAVIMPFVNWGVDHAPNHNDIIWCKPDRAPFDQLSVAPLKYGKALADTIFRNDYLAEKRFTYIDNLNLLYVAFTRAKHRLILFAPKPKKPASIATVADLLWRSITDLPAATATEKENEKENILLSDYFTEEEGAAVFTFGNASLFKSDEKKGVLTHKTGQWQSHPFHERLQLRLNSLGFFSDDGRRDHGKMMHDMISHVETVADIPGAVAQKISEGELKESEREGIVSELTGFLSLPEISRWYSGQYRVLNEAQVLHPRRGLSRPDRVMIGDGEVIVADYKFGESEDRRYNRQVQRYVKSIAEMGFEKVKGYVVYVKLGKVISI